MPAPIKIEKEIIDDIKFGALEVINKELEETISAGTNPEAWSQEDKAKYFLILDVQEEILMRVSQTFRRSTKTK